MKIHLQKAAFVLLALTLSLTACKESGNDGPTPVVGELVSDVPGNISTTVGTTFAPVADIQANVSTTTGTTFAPVADIPGNTENEPGYTFYDLIPKPLLMIQLRLTGIWVLDLPLSSRIAEMVVAFR